MFKNSNKQQLGGLGERYKLPQCGSGWSLGCESISGILAAQKTYLLATTMVIFVCRNMSI